MNIETVIEIKEVEEKKELLEGCAEVLNISASEFKELLKKAIESRSH